MRILVAEDEPRIAAAVARGLRREGMAVDVAGDGAAALYKARVYPYDVVVLDRDLPEVHGDDVCRTLSAEQPRTKVLMLTAARSTDELVEGLALGADDYLSKPFRFAELVARLRALARRGPVEHPPVLAAGDLRLDPATRRVSRGDTDIALSSREYALLETFMRRPGQVLDRFQLLEHAWDDEYENRSNIVDVYVRYLREKVDRPFGVASIETVRGAGYRLRGDGGRGGA
jgi:two-component system OmpR family response regulator